MSQSDKGGDVRSEPFVHRRRVRWADVDVAGAVDLGTLTRYTMEALEEWFLNRLGADWSELQLRRHIATPFVHAELNFHRPVGAGESLEITVTVENVERSSIVFQIMGCAEKDGHRCWDGRFTCVFADVGSAGNLKSISIPAAYRELIGHPAKTQEG